MTAEVVQFPKAEPKRWRAQIKYRAKNGADVRVFQIEEIEDLHNIVEDGPHWDTIINIQIWKNYPEVGGNPFLTLEEAEKL